MNNVVNQPALPPELAYLATLQRRGSAAAAKGGIATGGSATYQIGIKAARWRLQDPQGQETLVPTHYLDVIVVTANPNASKIYYEGAYNPAEEGKGPDCWSDNGVAPDARAAKKQSATCATCPHNVWGSKVLPNGSAVKACADAKKLAVILADNPTGPVYLLKVPPASLKNLYVFVDSLDSRGYDLSLFVVRLEFDTSADFPKITFSLQGWVSAQQGEAVVALDDSDEVKVVIGTKNAAAQTAIPAPVAQPAIAAPAAPAFQLPPVNTAPQLAHAQVQEAPKIRKPRTAKAAQEKAAAPAQSGFFAGLQQAAVNTAPVIPAPAAQVVMQPQATTQSLDDLIAQAMQA